MDKQRSSDFLQIVNSKLRGKYFRGGSHTILNQPAVAIHVDRKGNTDSRIITVRIFSIVGQVLNDHLLVILDADGDIIEFSWNREISTGQTIYRAYNVPPDAIVQVRFMKMSDFLAASREVEALDNDATTAEL